MRIEPSQFKAFLMDSGLVNDAQIKKAEKEAAKTESKLSDVLIKQGLVKQEDLIAAPGLYFRHSLCQSRRGKCVQRSAQYNSRTHCPQKQYCRF